MAPNNFTNQRHADGVGVQQISADWLKGVSAESHMVKLIS